MMNLQHPRMLKLLGLLLLPLLLQAAERTKITLAATTDLHAHIFPVDYFTNTESADGLARIATLIKEARRKDPDLVLLDCGDTIQGTPLGYLNARDKQGHTDPTILAMNALGYCSMTVGNHEFNFGRQILEKARSEAHFPWLSANIVKKVDGTPLFQPYKILQSKGVKIAILGITTAAIPNWENSSVIEDLDFQPPTAAAAEWVKRIRASENPDLLIVACHMGLEENLETGKRPPGQYENENTVLEIAQTVPGIDLLLMGHTHQKLVPLQVGTTLLAQAGNWGRSLLTAEFYLERESPNEAWSVLAKAAHTTPADLEVKADPEIMALVAPYHDRTQQWLDMVIGHCEEPLKATTARREDSALLDLIHKAQLWAGRAEVSFAASFNPRTNIPQGPVTVRNIYSLYTYENTLVVVELSGASIKAALEHAAAYYLPWREKATAEQLADPQIPGYNFDTAEGVEYTIDLRRPIGDRIVNLSFQGKPIDHARLFRVAVNNYRQNGGGNYTMFKTARILERSSEEVRSLIIKYVESQGKVDPKASDNWRLLGVTAEDPASTRQPEAMH